MIRAVDLFAGAGGMSLGAELAGLEVLAAVNHWPIAVASHAANHPRATHHCEDLAVMDPYKLPDHDVMLAAPVCGGHAKARGKERAHHDASRSTAWCVVRVAEAKRPRWLVIENVPEMLSWALFPAWKHALELLGYGVTTQVVRAEETGEVPQRRHRLVIVGHLGRPMSVRIEPRPPMAARTVLVPYYGSSSSHAGVSLDGPIGTLTTRDRYVLVRGELARVLTVQEQLALSGFPRDYALRGTRREQVMQVGNAVPPPLAAAVLRSLLH